MDYNCRRHRANLVEDFLFEEGIVRMEWPACSPDMNPIEHVWDALGRRVAGRQPPPQTLRELERALLEEWDRIPQLVINSLIDSMPQSSMCSPCAPPQGMTHSKRVTNTATAECRMFACIHDQLLVDRIFQFQQIEWTGLIRPGILVSPQPKVYWSQIWRPCKLATFANDS
ncbi:transposable element Tcb2 transposase [Trichonephila clavipes]|nr:transposable element Tcb2 transposase [Trichonephila clavipes]